MAKFIKVDNGWLNVDALVFVSVMKNAKNSYTVNCWDSSETPITFDFRKYTEALDFVKTIVGDGYGKTADNEG